MTEHQEELSSPLVFDNGEYKSELCENHIFFYGWTKYGPYNMVQIIFTTGANYAYNHDNNGDLIRMQSQLQRGLYVIYSILYAAYMIYVLNFFMAKFVQKTHATLGRFSTWQAYLVPIKIDCKHIICSI